MINKEYIKISEYAKLMSLNTRTVYRYYHNGKKDRLTRFGFNYIDILLKTHNKKLEVINLADNDKEDLINDFTSVITLFYDKIYGQNRSKHKLKQLIKELNDSQESS